MAAATVGEYIDSFPDDVQEVLRRVRQAITSQVPGGEQKIRYAIPAVMLGGRYAVHFAAWKRHIGLYPIPQFDEPLESEVAPYRQAKDSVNFPYAKPIPYDLIERMTAEIVARRAAAATSEQPPFADPE